MSDDDFVFDPTDDYDVDIKPEKKGKKRKAESGAPPTKKKKNAKYKTLNNANKTVAKNKAKASAKAALPAVGFFYIPLNVNLNHLYIFGNINVVSVFNDPNPCPNAQAPGYWRGGQQIQVRLGPKLFGVVKGNQKTYKLPNALTQARAAHPAHGFVSGHMLNGEMGGDGADESHVTILSHQANMDQKFFDQAIKRAQNSLHQFYLYLGGLMPTGGQGFIDALGYGIDVTITMGGGTMGLGFPENCVADTMTLNAVIVGEPNLATWLVPGNFQNIKAGAQAFLARKIQEVQNEVNNVNGHVVNNP
jgi:hypothetical protein